MADAGPETPVAALRARLDELIPRVLRGDRKVMDLLHAGRWRAELDATGVDSGQLGYADNLLDEAHSILRRDSGHRRAAVEKLERARGKLV